MNLRDILSDDELLLEGRNYVHRIRRALVCLLLGGGFLGLERLLHEGTTGARLLVHLSEFLGWVFLVSSTLFLFSLSGGPADRKRSSYSPLLRRRQPARLQPSGERSQAIEALYAELRPLMSRAVADPSLKDEVQEKLSVLRRLQTEEAEEMEKRFEASLLLKPGEGWQALERTRELLSRYEDPSSPRSSTSRKD